MVHVIIGEVLHTENGAFFVRALVYHGNHDLRIQNVPYPRIGPSDVILKIDYCGICATDVEEYVYGPKFIFHDDPNPITGYKTPIVTGHEVTGTVEEIGSSVSGFNIGQRVVIDGILTCEKCWWCLRGFRNQCKSMATVGFAINGGLAEYMSWPASKIIPIPDQISSEAAALVEPASVAIHAIRRAHIDLYGPNVAVLGAGTGGILAIQAAKALGARVIAIDNRAMGLDLASRLGADDVINTIGMDMGKILSDLTDGKGPDVIVDAAGGKDTPELSIESVRSGGRVVLVAIYTSKPQFDFNNIVGRELDVVGSIGYERQDVEEVVNMISTGDLKPEELISDVIGLDEILEKGFPRMLAKSKDVFRILVSPSK